MTQITIIQESNEIIVALPAIVVTEAGTGPDTAEEIKTKYESNPDTNAYTDAEKVKLADAMQVSIYDINGNGIVDNAGMVNGHTVDIDVPADAKFIEAEYQAGLNVWIDVTNPLMPIIHSSTPTTDAVINNSSVVGSTSGDALETLKLATDTLTTDVTAVELNKLDFKGAWADIAYAEGDVVRDDNLHEIEGQIDFREIKKIRRYIVLD
jgi:hypothetical protein